MKINNDIFSKINKKNNLEFNQIAGANIGGGDDAATATNATAATTTTAATDATASDATDATADTTDATDSKPPTEGEGKKKGKGKEGEGKDGDDDTAATDKGENAGAVKKDKDACSIEKIKVKYKIALVPVKDEKGKGVKDGKDKDSNTSSEEIQQGGNLIQPFSSKAIQIYGGGDDGCQGELKKEIQRYQKQMDEWIKLFEDYKNDKIPGGPEGVDTSAVTPQQVLLTPEQQLALSKEQQDKLTKERQDKLMKKAQEEGKELIIEGFQYTIKNDKKLVQAY